MTSWPDIARDNLTAAKVLRDAGHSRSAVSRAYYAVFSVIVARLPDERSPAHRDLPRLVDRHMGDLPEWKRRWLKSLIRGLYRLRLNADYAPAEPIDSAAARDAIRDCSTTFRLLEDQ